MVVTVMTMLLILVLPLVHHLLSIIDQHWSGISYYTQDWKLDIYKNTSLLLGHNGPMFCKLWAVLLLMALAKSLYLSYVLLSLLSLGLWVSILHSSLSSCSALLLFSRNLISHLRCLSLSSSLCVFVLFCAEETGVDISHLNPCSV